ncbi:hypothetical protein ACIQF6_28485 [Kitasatospora sp. NPDC092948]|uniref:hypothetical protein n=1 Tax=Kitasatospora sp. NPDC092948 TaxID=3364088 RepID=UPI003809D0CD
MNGTVPVLHPGERERMEKVVKEYTKQQEQQTGDAALWEDRVLAGLWRGVRSAPGPVKLVPFTMWVGTFVAAKFGIRYWRALLPFHTAGAMAAAAAVGVPGVLVAGGAAATGAELALRLVPARQPPEDEAPNKAELRRVLARSRLSTGEAIYMIGLWASVWGWLAAASAGDGLHAPLPGWLGVGTAVFGSGWWWMRRLGAAAARGEPEEQEADALDDVEEELGEDEWDDEDDPLGEQHQVWADYVGNPVGALPGAELEDLTIRDGNWSGIVVLRRGGIPASNALAAKERIAMAYDVPEVSVALDLMPGESRRLKLSIYEQDPLMESVEWAGPHLLDPTTGIAPIGSYQDRTPVQYRFWMPRSGPVHDLIAGTTGAGKSGMLGMLLSYERFSEHLVSFVVDGKLGQSLPDWQDNVHWYADHPDEWLYLLRALVGAARARQNSLARLEWEDEWGQRRIGVSDFDPVELGLPILSLTMDESQKILRPNGEAVALCEEYVGLGRSAGGRLRIANLMPVLDQMGNSSLLRDTVASGNIIVLRTGSPTSGQAAFHGTVPVQPHLIPKAWPNGSSTSGLGFADVPDARRSMLRLFWNRNPYRWATNGQLQELQEQDALALGPFFENWRERREDRRNGIVARVAVDGLAGAQQQVALAAGSAPAPAFAAPVAAGGPEATVAQLKAQAEAAATAVPVTDGSRSTYRSDVLSLLRSDLEKVWTNAEIIDRTGFPKTTVASTLKRLNADGLVLKPATGQWKAAGPRPASLPQLAFAA